MGEEHAQTFAGGKVLGIAGKQQEAIVTRAEGTWERGAESRG